MDRRIVWQHRSSSSSSISGGGPAAETRVDMANIMAMSGYYRYRDDYPEQQRASRRGLERNDRATLLLVATLVTTLLYQVGSNVPGGYWQDNNDGHRAGDAILRDEHYGLYMLLRWSSWVGFGSSMVLTMGLLTGVATGSRFVRWLLVVAYSTLVLTFVASQTHSSVCSDVLVWIAVMAALAFAVTYRRLSDLVEWLCGDKNIAVAPPHDGSDDDDDHLPRRPHLRRLDFLVVLPYQ